MSGVLESAKVLLVVLSLNTPDPLPDPNYRFEKLYRVVTASPEECRIEALGINAYSDATMRTPAPSGEVRQQHIAWCAGKWDGLIGTTRRWVRVP